MATAAIEGQRALQLATVMLWNEGAELLSPDERTAGAGALVLLTVDACRRAGLSRDDILILAQAGCQKLGVL